jgi:copper(I)-binding protein
LGAKKFSFDPLTKNGIVMKKPALMIAAALVLVGCSQQPEISVENYWVKSSEMSVEGGMTAVYGTITNNSGRDVVLLGGSTEVAGIVEVHEMAMIDGQMKMQKIDGGLTIPAGKSVVLEPGGNHLMLMELTGVIEPGSQISVTLDFEGTQDVTLEGVVAKPAEGGDEEYHKEGMDH